MGLLGWLEHVIAETIELQMQDIARERGLTKDTPLISMVIMIYLKWFALEKLGFCIGGSWGLRWRGHDPKGTLKHLALFVLF